MSASAARRVPGVLIEQAAASAHHVTHSVISLNGRDKISQQRLPGLPLDDLFSLGAQRFMSGAAALFVFFSSSCEIKVKIYIIVFFYPSHDFEAPDHHGDKWRCLNAFHWRSVRSESAI